MLPCFKILLSSESICIHKPYYAAYFKRMFKNLVNVIIPSLKYANILLIPRTRTPKFSHISLTSNTGQFSDEFLEKILMHARKIERFMKSCNKELMLTNRSRKILHRTAAYVIFFIAVLIIFIMVPYLTSHKKVHHLTPKYPTDMKYILFWKFQKVPKSFQTLLLGNYEDKRLAEGQTLFIEQNCPKINCYITYDRNILDQDEEFDAVVFNLDHVRRVNLASINLTRSPEQIYIFKSTEPPEKHLFCSNDFDKFFNWTWTYKLNSDLPEPSFRIYDSNNTVIGPKKGIIWIDNMTRNAEYVHKIKFKRAAVAWVTNECQYKDKHKHFIKDLRYELSWYKLTLDTFGSCGSIPCPHDCQKLIEANYYFQLVLEDYASEDYVSNIMVTALAHYTVPILFGPGDYRFFFPPTAYINGKAYGNKKLAGLVDHVMKNTELYGYFFDWKNHYYLRRNPKHQVCDLCEKINEKNRTWKYYQHFRYWWEPQYKEVCAKARLYTKLKNENSKT